MTFQGVHGAHGCDQQYVMRTDGSGMRRISNGLGRTTCGWWLAGDRRILFSSTFASDPHCPRKPDMSQGYVWPVYPTYCIYSVKPNGSDLKRLFPRTLRPGELPGYNAESVVSPDGMRITFTSSRGGDLDVWVMNVDGTHAKQLTHALGYNGGPWWSPDGKRIVYRAYHPKGAAAVAEYKRLLAKHLVRPTTLDLFVMNADGSHNVQVTHDRAANIANFAPTWSPDGKWLVFASNRADKQRMRFDLWRIRPNGSGLERLTWGGFFDAFPCFSPNGKQIAWISARGAKQPDETNVFIADWRP
ncbi:MAG: PD40 domain-containing protein [Armatimonadetes bacterium]|nr:PD40 domain-containing protein [Armatimonadota bacterium]MDE2207056.1 PD40 domain-containing protein [Armatimonadota bacterium]